MKTVEYPVEMLGEAMDEKIQPLCQWIDGQEERMIELISDFSAINSFTTNFGSICRLQEQISPFFAQLAEETRRFPLPPYRRIDSQLIEREYRLPDLLSFKKRGRGNNSILLLGHLDTVHPPEGGFQSVLRKNDRLMGPGVCDMKGGIVIMLIALEAFSKLSLSENISWEVILNPDEEIGSPQSGPLLRELAQGHRAAFIFEPPPSSSALIHERPSSMNLLIQTKGRSAHAGRNLYEGKNAIYALQPILGYLEKELAERKLLINVGMVHGGTATNTVPDHAAIWVNVRGERIELLEQWCGTLQQFLDDVQKKRGTESLLTILSQRPEKTYGSSQGSLFALVRKVASNLGISLELQKSGGVCDGNNLAFFAQLPTVDTMGAVGGAIHSPGEYIDIPLLTQRAKLFFLTLVELANKEIL